MVVADPLQEFVLGFHIEDIALICLAKIQRRALFLSN